ncbi:MULTISPECIES: ferrous iron transporter B [Asticcacaulis]|uniref:ferrous iron transporter B n=1 Tax=Asticcacaulis TaxID=76890 RepID=UPI001AE7C3B5|nr:MULTISPECIES: ferrous iron transporter B [Asticcacaulis]MBP2161457.1 ferrous iron transport protein B [Asticcacaulis solisilvae]MDR6802502.1 ferrous iron transport protein B [Asticcacaulis sp. BE141]
MDSLTIALVGNPNCGKTALFNQLTGARQKVANYAGVTVERKEGSFTAPSGRKVKVLDLPGTYSLDAMGADEIITRDVCLGKREEEMPDLIVCVADATNLRLHLRFVLEVKALGRPMVVALNMMDAAQQRGIKIDVDVLSRELGLTIIGTVATKVNGAADLVAYLDRNAADHIAPEIVPDDLHAEVRRLLDMAVVMPTRTSKIDDALDRFFLNPVFGLPLLIVLMFVIFQAVFAWAAPLQDGIEGAFGYLAGLAGERMPEGLLKSFIVDAVINGMGAVLVFLPQILILFFFILILEESGYLPRAAFMLDKIMAGAGLTGRSFIPLLSSHACAIPGIMATRSIPDVRERLTTIMIAPLMTCSARLPVYALLIPAFIAEQTVGGFLSLHGLILFALYIVGILSGLAVSWVMSLTRRKLEYPLMMELPSYRLPGLRNLALGLLERARIFIRRITGTIFAANTILWVLTTFPGKPEGAEGPAVDYSFAGIVGHAMQPLFAPVGFNWQICVALIPGLTAREVAVSSLATVYSVGAADEGEAASQLGALISSQWPIATGLSLMAWYVFAPQCLSTLAVIRRETNSWKTVGLTAGYLFVLAYIASFITYQLARQIWPI